MDQVAERLELALRDDGRLDSTLTIPTPLQLVYGNSATASNRGNKVEDSFELGFVTAGRWRSVVMPTLYVFSFLSRLNPVRLRLLRPAGP